MPWRQAAHDRGLHWEIDIPDTLPVIEIDPDRRAQVLGNLLSNAIKYTPGGPVSVQAGVRDGEVAIVVGDTGIGIAPSEQACIFDPFYRSQRDKRFPQGMGLGLSIARDLVVAHGGRLEVESQLEKGSRFTILLPLQAVQHNRSSSSIPHPAFRSLLLAGKELFHTARGGPARGRDAQQQQVKAVLCVRKLEQR